MSIKSYEQQVDVPEVAIKYKQEDRFYNRFMQNYDPSGVGPAPGNLPNLPLPQQNLVRKAFVSESDNSYVAYIVKRIVADHGDSNEKLGLILEKTFASAYQGAIADLNGDMYTCSFYFFNLFAINK